MLTFTNGGRLVENAAEMPSLPHSIDRLYCDFETSSGSPDLKSLNPWRNCSALGAAVTWDRAPGAWYIPTQLLMTGWLRDAFAVSTAWVNHNVKYDAHVAYNDLGLEFIGDLRCTIAKCKIVDSDRMFRGGYGLGALASTMLGQDIRHYEDAMQPYLGKNRDYAAIPIDLIAEYACQDVLTNRALDVHLDAEMPEESAWIHQNEVKLTGALVRMERRGMYIDPVRVKTQLMLTVHRMNQIEERLEQLLGYRMLPTSYDEVYDLMINRYGLPFIVSDRNVKKGVTKASFDKNILKNYAALDTPYREQIALVGEYRKLSTRKGLFWENFLDKHVDGLLHPDYQQNVRSGRTACKDPNAQQADKNAKGEIRPRPGYKLKCYDHSQLEYRVMAHVVEDEGVIAKYAENPRADFHQWMADMCGIKRTPAKTMNFTIMFGGGKAKVVKLLSIDPDIIARGGDVTSEAVRIYNGYYRSLPSLKRMRRMAENAARLRGYVRTEYGRRLHLPDWRAHVGFSRVVQSTAGDASKEGVVAVSESEVLRKLDAHLVAFVHDEFLFEIPDDPGIIERADAEIVRCLESPSRRFRIPIIVDKKEAADTWADAKP